MSSHVEEAVESVVTRSPRERVQRGPSAAGWAAMLVFVGVLGYLSLRGSPHLRTLGWVPEGIAHWVDHHGVSRNTIAFGAFALVVGLACPTRRSRRWGYAGIAAFAVVTELAQWWIPTRFCDWRDIAAAGVGIAAAAGAVRGVRARRRHAEIGD